MASPAIPLTTRAQREACERAIRRGLEPIRIPAPLTLSQWADREFYLSSESSAIEGPWQSLPFQRDIMDCISNDDIRIIDWLKCARVGYTKILMAAAGYFVSYMRRSGAIYQPTDTDAQEFSKAEIDPMIRDCKAIRDAFKGDVDRRGKDNTLDMKAFMGALLYIRGAHTPRSFRRLTIDWVFYDELEGFERDIGEEGDPVQLGDARISNSAYPKSVRGSTPRLKHDSLIQGEAERAKHFFRYRVPCLECEWYQALLFGQLRWDRDDANSVRYVCEHCEHSLEYQDLGEMLERGFWGTDDGHTIRDGQLVDPDGKLIDWSRHIAFHIWAAYSPFFKWSELVEEWFEAMAANKQGDVRKLKTFTNTRLAESWEEIGEQVAYDSLFSKREDYTRPPEKALLLTATWDVQDDRLEGEVIAWGRGEESWGVEYRVIYGDPTQREVWEELEVVIGQKFDTEDGRTLQIAGVAIDSGHLADHVYQFYKSTRHPRVYIVKGAQSADAPIVSAPHQRKSGRSKSPVPLFMFGTNICKSITYRRLALDGSGPGRMHFPMSYDEDYFRSLTAERKLLKRRRGFEVVEWVKTRARNEALDVRAMGLAVLAILNPVWDSLDPAGREPDPGIDKPADPYIPHAHHKRERANRRRYGDRWRER